MIEQRKSRKWQGDEAARLVSEAMSLLRGGKLEALLQLVTIAQAEGARDPRLLVLQAYAHATLGQLSQALAAADVAMAAPLSEVWALDLLGNTFTLCQRPSEAYAAFSRACEIAPDQPDVLFNFATAAAFMGFTDQAESAYDHIIQLAPDNAEAYLNRSQLRWQTPDRNHVAELSAALDGDPLSWQREVHLRYALGKELEDLGDYDGAFAQLSQGAAVRRRHMRYAVADDVAAMQRIAATHGASWCANVRKPHLRDGPVFILGMPRSGSTLLERMLGRHSQVQALGELPFFGQALIGSFHEHCGRMPADKNELIDLSASLDPLAIGQAYLSAVAPLRDARARFTDKLPINFLYAGLIARALPGATLLHIRRKPMDLCFAIFKTLFRDAYPFSYDLAELGTYHRAYLALMDHWREALGDRLVEIDYEELVTAPRPALEAVLPRLGLGFEEACLRPEKDRTGVMTASASQVRQPIHSASVGSAARYASHLEPLRIALGE